MVSSSLSAGGLVTTLLEAFAAGKPLYQGIALTFISNCMVDKPAKSALAQAISEEGQTAPQHIQALLGSSTLLVKAKVLNMLVNASADVGVRSALAASGETLKAMLSALTNSPKGADATLLSELQLAALSTLFNISLDAGACELLVQANKMPQLLALLGNSDAVMVARAAGLVARLIKCAAGLRQFISTDGVPSMVQLVSAEPSTPPADAPSAAATAAAAAAVGAGNQPLMSAADIRVSCIEAAVRALAIATSGSDLAPVEALEKCKGPAALLGLLKRPGMTEAVLGNAALCIGNVAKHNQFLPLLQQLDAVAPLVKVAYDGKGNTASKNAAIAMARLAHDAAMLERLRELHGIEIIYQYVKP